MQTFFLDALVALGLERTGHALDGDVVSPVRARGRQFGLPAAQQQGLFQRVFKAVLRQRFARKTMMDAQHVAEVAQQPVIDDIGLRMPFDPQERTAELRNHRVH